MAGHIAVAVLHGISSEEEHYSVELKHRVTEAYVATAKGHTEEDLIWQEIYWGDLLREQQLELVRAVNYRNDLAYPNLREWILDYMSTALLYRAGSPLYQQIHTRIQAQITRMAHHRRVDAESTPLVVLAHSFGAVIAAHYMADVQRGQWAKPAPAGVSVTPFERFDTIAGLITFGSPLAIWANQYGPIPLSYAGPNLSPVIAQKARWLNFYDKDDIIAYPMKGLSDYYAEKVSAEFEVNVGSARTSWNPACHNGYWDDPDFYKPVAAYLGDLRGGM